LQSVVEKLFAGLGIEYTTIVNISMYKEGLQLLSGHGIWLGYLRDRIRATAPPAASGPELPQNSHKNCTKLDSKRL